MNPEKLNFFTKKDSTEMRMRWWVAILRCLFGVSPITAIAVEPLPSEAWIAFATPSYFALLEVTVASVHQFSSRPIIAVGVNGTIPFSTEKYPRLIKKRIDVDLSQESIFFQKPRVILESGLDFGVYIEADDILIEGCDDLFQYAHLESPYPLCPVHPNDCNSAQKFMEKIGVLKKSMPYVHAHVIFSYCTIPFIKEWYETCLLYADQPGLLANFDETALNGLLWKKGVKDALMTYDPYYTHVDDFLQLSSTEQREAPYCHYKMFHGCKDPSVAWEVFKRLKERKR